MTLFGPISLNFSLSGFKRYPSVVWFVSLTTSTLPTSPEGRERCGE